MRHIVIERYAFLCLNKGGFLLMKELVMIIKPEKLEEVKEKKRKTCLERYGVEYVSQAPAFKEASLASTKKTCLEKYGVDSTFKLPANRAKQKETMLKRYGVTAPLCVPEFHHKALSKRGMTKPEKKLHEFLTSRNIPFKYSYDCNGKCFDFAVFKNEICIGPFMYN